MPETAIRPAEDADMPAITALYAHHVRHGTGTFETDPPSLAEMIQRRTEVLTRGLPYLVATRGADVIGFAYCNWFKPRPAYRYSAEDSIYVAPGLSGQGVGRRLLQALAEQAQSAGGVAQSMERILLVTDQTAQGTRQAAQSIGQLATLARELKSSVARFRVG